MNADVVWAYRMGDVQPNKQTLRILNGTRYAVSSTGAWIRLDRKVYKNRNGRNF